MTTGFSSDEAAHAFGKWLISDVLGKPQTKRGFDVPARNRAFAAWLCNTGRVEYHIDGDDVVITGAILDEHIRDWNLLNS